MASRYRTAFMGFSGFVATTAVPAAKANPGAGDRKVVAAQRTPGRSARDAKSDVQKKIKAA